MKKWIILPAFLLSILDLSSQAQADTVQGTIKNNIQATFAKSDLTNSQFKIIKEIANEDPEITLHQVGTTLIIDQTIGQASDCHSFCQWKESGTKKRELSCDCS